VRSIVISISVCLSARSLRNYMSKLHRMSNKCYLWPWLVLLSRHCNTLCISVTFHRDDELCY